jgi:uracil-DNA glycosylase family 4
VPSRSETYRQLVQARKSCKACVDLRNAAEIEYGVFDSSHIGPWSRWLGDLNAKVMVIGQEWGDWHAFIKQQGDNGAYSATNEFLRELLLSIGVDTKDSRDTTQVAGVFLTNAVLCFKDEGCQGPVRDEWFANCGRRFLRPQIELIQPKAVVCLGERAFRAVLAAFEIPCTLSFRSAVDDSGTLLPSGSTAFAVYHCGRRILNTHRSRPQQLADWKRIASVL